ncbi:hypothetical protein AB4K20DRAFT_1889172 [Rhizopus microsporus]
MPSFFFFRELNHIPLLIFAVVFFFRNLYITLKGTMMVKHCEYSKPACRMFFFLPYYRMYLFLFYIVS